MEQQEDKSEKIDFFTQEVKHYAQPILDEKQKEDRDINMKIAFLKAMPLKVKLIAFFGISFILYIVGSGIVWNLKMLMNLF